MSTALQDYRVTSKVLVGGVNLTQYFISATRDSNVDASTDSVTVVFSRQDDWAAAGSTGSLAPLMATSPPIDLGMLLVISIAITALDTAPDSGDFVERFRGYIDRVEWPTLNARVTVNCRDLGGALLDLQIEEDRVYGADDDSVSAEDAMQQILDDNETGVTLYVPTPSGSFVPVSTQKEKSVMAALRDLAETIGWIVRYRYVAGVSKLSFYSPDRAKTAPDHTLGPDRYRDVTQMDVELEDVRNVVRVFYIDADGLLQKEVAEDSASITKYNGRRTLTIREGSDSPIRASAQALAMAEAAVADLAEPLANHAIETLILPEVELGDLIEFTANDVHYSSDQKFAVVSHQWTLTRDTHRSTIVTRGSPVSGWLRWLDRGGEGDGTSTEANSLAIQVLSTAWIVHPGVSAGILSTASYATLAMSLLPGSAVRSMRVKYRDVTDPELPGDWAEYDYDISAAELHVLREAVYDVVTGWPTNPEDEAKFYNLDTVLEVHITPYSAPGGAAASEFLTNGEFTGAATGWTLGAGWAYGSNAVTHTPGSTATLEQDPPGAFPIIVGRAYTIYVLQTAGTAGTADVSFGGVTGLPPMLGDAVGGSFSLTSNQVALTTDGVIITPSTDYDGTITSVSLKASRGAAGPEVVLIAGKTAGVSVEDRDQVVAPTDVIVLGASSIGRVNPDTKRIHIGAFLDASVYGVLADGENQQANMDALLAYAASLGGGRIILPDGIVLVDAVVVPPNVSLEAGFNWGSTLKQNPSQSTPLILLDDNNSRLIGLKIDGNASEQTGDNDGVHVTGSATILRDVLIQNCKGRGLFDEGTFTRGDNVTAQTCLGNGAALAGYFSKYSAMSVLFNGGHGVVLTAPFQKLSDSFVAMNTYDGVVIDNCSDNTLIGVHADCNNMLENAVGDGFVLDETDAGACTRNVLTSCRTSNALWKSPTQRYGVRLGRSTDIVGNWVEISCVDQIDGDVVGNRDDNTVIVQTTDNTRTVPTTTPAQT